ncbi:hypothetical protein [Devosia sp.]|uniref:hypothetical protein n=1 Tax=Devosia sp. TaxID=1871048 RepID=UPI0019DDBD35|nr:hypothetical protein [Devosia sp.]MBE0580196.1 hypothetical protein [Devosia sp.]
MRILVYLDTPRQRSYVASVKVAVSGLENARVLAGGPGATEGYFELADDADLSLVAKGPHVSLATRIRRALRDGWIGRHVGYTQLLEATRATRRRLRAAAKGRGTTIKSLRRRLVMALRPVWEALMVAAPVIKRPGQAIQTALRRYARAVRGISPIRLLQKQHQRLRALPSPMRQIAMFWSRATFAIAAVGTIALNSFGISRQVLQRRIHIHEATQLIERARPHVIVVMEDNAEGLTGVMTFAARRAGIPFVVLPDYIPNPIEPATYYWDSRAHQVRTVLDWLVATAYPKWAYTHSGRRMIRLPSPTILAYHLLGCDPPAPWILNSGYANAIGLDSTAMWTHYHSLGFREDKLRIIGTAQDDRLHARFSQRAELRAALMRDLGLPADRPVLLCAFPPDQYASSDTGSFEYRSYADLVAAWFAELAAISDRANVIVRPHPRTEPGFLEQACPPGVRVIWTPTEDLIPICDLYVASVSTTIRWALGLGLPVLNYDCYRYSYGDFSAAKGVRECTDRSAFSRNLQDLAHDTTELAARSLSDRHAWGQVDGQFASRLRHLLEEASEDVSKPEPTHTVPQVSGATHIRAVLARLRSQR